MVQLLEVLESCRWEFADDVPREGQAGYLFGDGAQDVSAEGGYSVVVEVESA